MRNRLKEYGYQYRKELKNHMFTTFKHRWNLIVNLSTALHDFSARLKLLEKRHDYLLRHANRQIRRRWVRQIEKDIHAEHIDLGKHTSGSCPRCSAHKKHLRTKKQSSVTDEQLDPARSG